MVCVSIPVVQQMLVISIKRIQLFILCRLRKNQLLHNMLSYVLIKKTQDNIVSVYVVKYGTLLQTVQGLSPSSKQRF